MHDFLKVGDTMAVAWRNISWNQERCRKLSLWKRVILSRQSTSSRMFMMNSLCIARRSRVYCIFLEQAKPLQIMPHQRFRDEWLCPRTLSASAFIPQRHQPPTIEPPQRALLLMTHFLRARLHSLVISGILHFVPPTPLNIRTVIDWPDDDIISQELFWGFIQLY